MAFNGEVSAEYDKVFSNPKLLYHLFENDPLEEIVFLSAVSAIFKHNKTFFLIIS